MEEWVSLREFSRRRGVALAAVQKAIDSGRVTAVRRDENGRLKGIEVNQATAQWDAKTDPVQAARTGQVLGTPITTSAGELLLSPPPGGQPESRPESQPDSGARGEDDQDDPTGYYEHRAKREEFNAKKAELDYLLAVGELVPAREIREVAARRYRAIRDKVLNIPDRLSAVLVGEARSGDPTTVEARVHAAMTKELKRVLHELSDAAGAEAALGAEERVAA